MKIVDQTTDDFEQIAANSAEVAESQKPTALDIGFDIDSSLASPEGQLSMALLAGNLGECCSPF